MMRDKSNAPRVFDAREDHGLLGDVIPVAVQNSQPSVAADQKIADMPEVSSPSPWWRRATLFWGDNRVEQGEIFFFA